MRIDRARLLRGLGRLGRTWIAVELTAGILALCLVVAVLPAVECLMALPPIWSWKAALGISASTCLGAVWLGRRALVLPAELLAGGAPAACRGRAQRVPAAR
jgi:hypothetical protein